jgi:dTDP-4-amino-4,6-dideoxygalactose transaminase
MQTKAEPAGEARRPMAVPFAPPFIGTEEIDAVVDTLRSGWLTTGKRVHEFERAFAEYVGTPHAVAVNSCTAALHLSLLSLGLGAGDEVITTPLTFCATANTVVHVGATPVFADIDRQSMNVDPAAIARAITPRTKAIIPVHFAGRPVDTLAIRALAQDRGIAVIEDAAHAVETVSRAGKVGSTADFTCFSFYATKNLTTGEGGMLTTTSAEHADRIRIAALHGMSRDAWTRYAPGGRPDYDVVMPGFKYNMMDIQAAIGLQQLARLDEQLRRREEIWRRYESGLKGLPVTLPAPPEAGTRHARHLFTILIDQKTSGHSRDDVAMRLSSQGIIPSVHFKALHLHPYYANRFGLARGMFPHAEFIADRTLSLPFSPALSDAQVDTVIGALVEMLGPHAC